MKVRLILFHLLLLVSLLWSNTALATPRLAPAGASILVNTLTDELNTDGDCALREAVCDTLELAGQTTISAAGGDEALQLLTRHAVSRC